MKHNIYITIKSTEIQGSYIRVTMTDGTTYDLSFGVGIHISVSGIADKELSVEKEAANLINVSIK